MSATETVLARGMQPDPTTPGVRINRLEVSNYKRIDHLAMEFPLPPMSKDLDIFVLGSKNGGGKSSVLECCALLLLAGAGGRMRIDRSSLGDVLPILIGLLIKAGRDAARISGELDAGGRACHIELRLDESGFAEPEVSGQCFPAVNDEKHARPADPDEALSSILAISSEPLIRPPLLHFNSYRKVLEFNPELGMLADDYADSRVSSLAWRRRMAMGRVGTAVSAFKLEVLRSLMGQASLFEGLDQQESEGILETLNNLIERYCGGRIDKLRALADNLIAEQTRPRPAIRATADRRTRELTSRGQRPGTDPRRRDHGAASSVRAATARQARPRRPHPDIRRPGLDSFGREQWPIFRGREAVVDRLLAHLRGPLPEPPGGAAEADAVDAGTAPAPEPLPSPPPGRCIALFGASGSGKSSVIRAGLLRRLEELPSTRDWPIAELRPGRDPLRNLASAIKTACKGRLNYDDEDQAAEIAAGGWDALCAAALAGRPGAPALVVFIDQFEELFTLTPDGTEPGTADRRTPFLRWLDAARADPRVRLLLTARDDFYSRFNLDPVLRAFLGDDHFNLGPPDHAERRRMVLEPARRAWLGIDPGLADRIARDTGDDPGALPFMAYALKRLYEHEQAQGSGGLTHPGYAAIGSVEGAVTACADAEYQKFVEKFGPEAARTAFEQLFAELVWVDDKGTAARRRAPRAALPDAPAGRASAAELARRLEHPGARLLSGDKEADGTPVIEVAHEALLRVWPPLTDWIKQRADDLTRYRWLKEFAERWARPANTDRQAPYSSAHLQPEAWVRDVHRALANLNKTPDDLEPHQRAFLDPDARARYLLAEDHKRWLDSARDPARLWTPDRFAACAGAGALPEPDGDTRAFLRASFDAALAAAADDPTARADIGLTLSNLGDPRFDPASIGPCPRTRPSASSRSRPASS
jgi:hypothetical protein